MIKCAIFDLDGTLYNYDKAHKAGFGALTDYAAAELGIPADEFSRLHKEIFDRIKNEMGNVAAIHNRLIRYQNILETSGIPLHPHLINMYRLYWNTFLNASEPYPYALETLHALKEIGIITGIGTDMTAWMQFKKLEQLKMLEYIDFVVTSEEACTEKPDTGFFNLCIKKSGCTPSECLFTGDSLKKDVKGALDAGMHALWFRPDGDDMGIDNVTMVSSLKDILCYTD